MEILSPIETLNELGTKEQFEKSQAENEIEKLEKIFWEKYAKHSEDFEGEERFIENNLSEKSKEYFDRKENVDEKINQEYQDNMFEDMAIDAMLDIGLTEDEAERELEDFNS